MPPVIAYAVTQIGASLYMVQAGAFLIANAAAIGTAVSMAGAVAYSSAQNSRMRRALNAPGADQGRNLMVRDPISPRRLIYGQVLVSGTVVFIHTTGTKNEYLHLVIVLAGHEVDEIGDIYFNDEVVPFDGVDNAATGKYAGYARCNKKRGVPADTADHYLIAEAPAYWTSDHKLGNCAYINVRLKWSTELFPNGLPTIRALVKGKKVWDPRTSTTVFSSNSALCAADYLTDTVFGKGIAYARLNESALIEAANICDEDVTLDDLTTENRYATNGTILADQDPAEVLRALAGAMAGHVVDTGGNWTVRAGAHRSSVLTLTDDDLIGPFSVLSRQSRQDTFNRVRGVFISPDNQWAPADFPAVENSSYKADDGDIWLERDVQYNFTTSNATAQRLAKIELERGRQQITCSGLLTLKAMQCMPGDTVAITRSRLGWSAKLFEVVDWSFKQTGDGENLGLGIELNLRETAAGAWDWNNGEETVIDLAPNTELPDPFTVPTPSLTLLTDSTTVTVQSDGTVQPRLKVSWATPNDIHVESGGAIEIEYKKTADADYTVWAAPRGDSLFDYILDVKVGIQYDVRARFRNNLGVRGAYGTATSSAIVGDTTTPSAATSLVATAKPGFIDLTWTPSASNTVNEYAIYRSITSAVAGFSLLANTANSQFQDPSVTAGVNYWYYVVATSASEVSSASTSVAGPVTALIAPIGVLPTAPSSSFDGSDSGTYDATDGSVFAYVTLGVWQLPLNATWQNVLYRRSGAAEWLIATQLKDPSSTVFVRVDDLTPGVTYDFATQSWNSAGGSAVTAMVGTSLTAPAKSTAAGVPTSATLESGATANAAPSFQGSALTYACVVRWTNPADADLDHIELKATATNTDGATDYSWWENGGNSGLIRVPAPNKVAAAQTFTIYNASLLAGFVRIRAVNASGIASAWVSVGNANAFAGYPGGTTLTTAMSVNDFNVDNYGAVGDGAVDDSLAVTDAIAAVVAAGGGDVYFTPGKAYYLPGLITITDDNVWLNGYGALIVGTDDTDIRKFRWEGVTRGGARGIRFDGQYATATTGIGVGVIEISESEEIEIKDCIFDGIAKHAIYAVGACRTCKIVFNRFKQTFCSILLDDDGVSQPERFQIIGNHAIDGIGTSATPFSGFLKISGYDDQNSYCGHVISNNICDDVGEMGIELQSMVNGCVIANNTIARAGFGYSISGCKDISMTGNIARACVEYGIEVTGITGVESRNVSVTGGTVYGSDTAGTVVTNLGVVIGKVVGVSLSGITVTQCGSYELSVVDAMEVSVLGCRSKGKGFNLKNSSIINIIGGVMTAGTGANYFVFVDSNDAAVTRINISENTFDGSVANNGIALYSPANSIADVKISNNITTGASAPGWMFNVTTSGAGSVSRVRVFGNMGDGEQDFTKNFNVGVLDVSSGLTLDAKHETIIADSTGTNITLDLPTANGLEGKTYTVVKKVSWNTVTIDGFGSETINGSATVALTGQWSAIRIASDGANWYTVAYRAMNESVDIGGNLTVSGTADIVGDVDINGEVTVAGQINTDDSYFVNGTRVVTSQQATISDAPLNSLTTVANNAATDASTSNSLTGADTVSKAATESALNSIGTKYNDLAGKYNDLANKYNALISKTYDTANTVNIAIDRLVAHGLVAP